MPGNEEQKENQSFKLSLENQKNIDDVRRNFEDFYREEITFQAEMKNQLNIVSEQQKSLRERFEIGTASTLRELKKSFDEFRVEWGKKLSEDEKRDEDIQELKGNFKWLIRLLILPVFIASVIYIFQTFASK